MTDKRSCDALVVGGGPGGYAAAIRCGKLGLNTILVEADKVGGTCLIRGCIPSKALIEAASAYEKTVAASSDDGNVMGISVSKAALDFKQTITWKDGIVNQLNQGVSSLVKGAGTEIIQGWATFKNAKTCSVETSDGVIEISANNVILAAGSVPVEIPSIAFGGNIISSTEALDLSSVPKKLLILGAGYIGVELGMAYAKLGSEVEFIEGASSILPGFDRDLVRPVERALKKLGVKVTTGANAQAAEQTAKTVSLTYTDKDGAEQLAKGNKLLVTVGRRPKTDGWGLEEMAVDMDGRFIKVDEQCQTSMKGVYAIGDLVGEPMLAHKATAQGEIVAGIIAGHQHEFSPTAIPAICYTSPEIVSVGLTEEQAKAQYGDVVVGKFPLAANGRALTMNAGASGGFVRIIARQDNQLLLGVQAVGDHVSELSGEFITLLEMGATLEDVAGTIHAHPTLTEATLESALVALGRPIHVGR